MSTVWYRVVGRYGKICMMLFRYIGKLWVLLACRYILPRQIGCPYFFEVFSKNKTIHVKKQIITILLNFFILLIAKVEHTGVVLDWDSNMGPQNGRHRRTHRPMTARKIACNLIVNFLFDLSWLDDNLHALSSITTLDEKWNIFAVEL